MVGLEHWNFNTVLLKELLGVLCTQPKKLRMWPQTTENMIELCHVSNIGARNKNIWSDSWITGNILTYGQINYNF